MSELVVIAFDSEEKAEDIRDRLLDLQKSHIVSLADAVIATKNAKGRIKLNQLASPATSGAISGGFWGLLIGALFLAPHIGLLVGAASGGLAGALTTAVLLFPIIFILTPKISAFLELDVRQFNYLGLNFWSLFALQCLTGILLGVVSSVIVIRRYLRI